MLPIFQSDSRDMNMMQTVWASQLNPILSLPFSGGTILEGVVLAIGSNVINHLLQRKLQGWMVVDQNASASIYRSAAKNNLTLTLTSDAIVTVDIFVF